MYKHRKRQDRRNMLEQEGRMFLSALSGKQSINKYSDLVTKDIPDNKTHKFSVLIMLVVIHDTLIIHDTTQYF